MPVSFATIDDDLSPCINTLERIYIAFACILVLACFSLIYYRQQAAELFNTSETASRLTCCKTKNQTQRRASQRRVSVFDTMGDLQKRGRSIVALTDKVPTSLSVQEEEFINSILGSDNYGESMVTSRINYDGFQSGEKAATLSLSGSNENLGDNIIGIANVAKPFVLSPPSPPLPSHDVIKLNGISRPKIPTLSGSEREVINNIMNRR